MYDGEVLLLSFILNIKDILVEELIFIFFLVFGGRDWFINIYDVNR